MSDLGETFAMLREHGQDKRASNRESSAALLAARGVSFVSHNNGAHLIVGDPPLADFWPGTGLWILRAGGRKGRGVRRLLATLGLPREVAERMREVKQTRFEEWLYE